MGKLLVVLQCEYRDDCKRIPYDEWLPRLWQSYTGKRLSEMLPVDTECYVTNATLEVGLDSSAVFPPDLIYLREVVDSIQPYAILACGQVAQQGIAGIGEQFIAAPHPAWRQLSKVHTAQIRTQLEMLNGI